MENTMSEETGQKHTNEEYKWSYLASKYFPETGPERHKKLRMKENAIYLEKKVLTEEQVIKARKKAEEWEKKYWN